VLRADHREHRSGDGGLGPAVAGCKHGNRRVIAVDLQSSQNMLPDLIDQGRNQFAGCARPAGKCEAIEIDALACKDLRQPVERLVICELRHQNMCQWIMGQPGRKRWVWMERELLRRDRKPNTRTWAGHDGCTWRAIRTVSPSPTIAWLASATTTRRSTTALDKADRPPP
jgi:hypothetical protein